MADLLSRARRSSRARSANNWCKAGVHSIRPRRGAEGFDAFPSGTARARLLLVPSNPPAGIAPWRSRARYQTGRPTPIERCPGSLVRERPRASRTGILRSVAAVRRRRALPQSAPRFPCSRRCRRLVCAGSGRSCRSHWPCTRAAARRRRRYQAGGRASMRGSGHSFRCVARLAIMPCIKFGSTPRLGRRFPLPESRESWYAQQAAVARLERIGARACSRRCSGR